MKDFGILLVICAVIGIFASLGMDTSVSTGYGDRVNNIGLMNDKQNYIILSSVILVAGLIMAVAGSSSRTAEGSSASLAKDASFKDDTRNCPFCAETIRKEAVKCRFCGDMVEPIESVETEEAGEGSEDDQTAWVAELAAREEEKRKVAATHKVIGAVVGGFFVLTFLLAAILL